MSFSCEIWRGRASGVEVARIEFPLTVLSPNGEVEVVFRLDTGADITTISEDVATACAIPAGGTPVPVAGVGGQANGRLVDIRVRFPPDEISGRDGLEADCRCVVIPNRTDTALLSLADVHRHFSIGTDDLTMYFAGR
jgi:hypothetical protein